jgi:4-diphosphocytidyl-2-C-methyl-D-erythritol kinase
MAVVTEYAPAKVNLTLEVLGKRADGYHELSSLVAFTTGLGDVVILDTAKPVGVSVSGPFATSIAGANLIETTLRLIEMAAPDLQCGAVHLEKNLPVAAGIGGGSSDAAAVIRAVRTVNGADAEAVDWQALALRLGADVPVCLASQLSWMTGLGERVRPLPADIALPAVIVNPLVPVPADKTAQVFRALRAGPLPEGYGSGEHAQGPLAGDQIIDAVMRGTNKLEAPALTIVPEIKAVLTALAKRPGCRLARMSGGGPTCFALFGDDAEAQAAAAQLSAGHPDWWVRATVLG